MVATSANPAFLSVRFPKMAASAKGTLPSYGQTKVERQQTEWTGRRVCQCQQVRISLILPLVPKRVRHHGHGQLSAGLLPSRFPGRPAAGSPKLSSEEIGADFRGEQ